MRFIAEKLRAFYKEVFRKKGVYCLSSVGTQLGAVKEVSLLYVIQLTSFKVKPQDCL